MGASNWSYFVPYDASADRALQNLRAQVFREGKYGDGIPSEDQIRGMFEEMRTRNPSSALSQDRLEEMIQSMKAARSQIPPMPEPDSIEELLEQRAESGTHSILDIQSISDNPEFGSVSRFPAKELVRLFGSDKPTHEAVDRLRYDELLLEHPLISERWQGVYFSVYVGDVPTELFFIGTSGD